MTAGRSVGGCESSFWLDGRNSVGQSLQLEDRDWTGSFPNLQCLEISATYRTGSTARVAGDRVKPWVAAGTLLALHEPLRRKPMSRPRIGGKVTDGGIDVTMDEVVGRRWKKIRRC